MASRRVARVVVAAASSASTASASSRLVAASSHFTSGALSAGTRALAFNSKYGSRVSRRRTTKNLPPDWKKGTGVKSIGYLDSKARFHVDPSKLPVFQTPKNLETTDLRPYVSVKALVKPVRPLIPIMNRSLREKWGLR